MACPNALIVSVTWGGSGIPTPQGFQYAHTVEELKTRAAGKTGPGCNQHVRQALECVVTFLEPGFFEPNQAPADLVIVTAFSGTTRTRTLSDMIPRDFGETMDNNSPPGTYFQKFTHVGDMDSTPVAES